MIVPAGTSCIRTATADATEIRSASAGSGENRGAPAASEKRSRFSKGNISLCLGWPRQAR